MTAMPFAGRLSGSVVWKETGAGIADVVVEALRPTARRAEQWTTTREGGRYELTGLEVGRDYRIRLVLQGATQDGGQLTISSDKATQTFEMQPGGRSMATSTTTTTSDTTTSDTTTDTTTSDTTTDSTTTDSTTTGTDTSTSDTTTSVSMATSESTTTDSTTVTGSATTATGTTVTVAPGADPFEDLLSELRKPGFGPEPQVNLNDAREFRRLYTVGLYVLAQLPEAMDALFTALNESPPRLPLVNRDQLIAKDVLNRIGAITNYAGMPIGSANAANPTGKDNRAWLLDQMRRQFNLGGGSLTGAANTEFPTLFRTFVTQCGDELMGVDPETVKPKESSVVVDPRQHEATVQFLKRLKRSLLNVVQSMSVYGSSGTQQKVKEWSDHVADGLAILKDVGENHLGVDDDDDKHWLSVMATLVGTPRVQLRSYVVHAFYGGHLMQTAIDVHGALGAKLTDESEEHLRQLFHTEDLRSYELPDPNTDGSPRRGTAAAALKSRAEMVANNWQLYELR